MRGSLQLSLRCCPNYFFIHGALYIEPVLEGQCSFQSYSLIFSAIGGVALPAGTAASSALDSIAKFADPAR
jgi:hypothetical protein